MKRQRINPQSLKAKALLREDSPLNPWIIFALLAILALSFIVLSPPLQAADPEPKDWQEALRPLETTPVQDSGYIRSMNAYAQKHLSAITGESAWDGKPALLAILSFMADPAAAAKEPLLKVSRPEIGQALETKRISLETYRGAQFQQTIMQMLHRDEKGEIQDPKGLMPALNQMEEKAQKLENLEHSLAIIPQEGAWTSPQELSKDVSPASQEIVKNWESLKKAIQENDSKAGAQAALALKTSIMKSPNAQSANLNRLHWDSLFTRYQPFAKAGILYLLAALSYGAGILFSRKRLFTVGYVLLALGFVAQAVGIAIRWYISARPPLSNMYESFIFAICGMVLVALIFELTHKIRLAGLGAAFLGFIFMIIAFRVPVVFDPSINPLMPALQSSWLTYHVITIMLSYSAFALSFFVSVIYLGKDLLGGDKSRLLLLRRLPSLNALDVFNYKIIAVGFPLLTVGIILGAVWAATAWGRPWGFDPKETWSAITWLVYTVYLHARYIGGWKGRRAAVLAIIGFAAVLFTYFGVNYLLPGLHSYA